MGRIIDLDKLKESFQHSSFKLYVKNSGRGIATHNIAPFLYALKSFFEDNVTIKIAGKEVYVHPELLNFQEIIDTVVKAKQNYDNISIFFHFDETPYSVIYMYDEDQVEWIKTLSSGILLNRDYIFEVELFQQICQHNDLELNPYVFDILLRMYNDFNKTKP